MPRSRASISHLASSLSDHSTLSVGEAEEFVNLFFDGIRESLLTDKIVKVRGLGTFKLVDVEARETVMVGSGERLVVDGHAKVSFTPDPVLRDAVNRPFADFQTVEINEGVDLAMMEATGEPEASDESVTALDVETESPTEPYATESAETEPDELLASQTAEPLAAQPAEALAPQPAEPLVPQPEEPIVIGPSESLVSGSATDDVAEPAPNVVAVPLAQMPVADELSPEPDATRDDDNPTPVSDENACVSDESASLSDEPTPVTVATAPIADEPAPIADESAPVADESAPIADESAVAEEPAAESADGVTVDHANVVKHAQVVERAEYVRHSDRHAHSHRCWLYLLYALLGLIAGYVLGFYVKPIGLPSFISPEEARVLLEHNSEQQSRKEPLPPTHEPDDEVLTDEQLRSDIPQTSDIQPEATEPTSTEQPATGQPTSEAQTTTETTEASTASQDVSYPQLDGGEYEIVGIEGTEVMRPGKTLLNISIKYYGSKKFVDYICLMNGISNPDIVPLDKELQIPKLRKRE